VNATTPDEDIALVGNQEAEETTLANIEKRDKCHNGTEHCQDRKDNKKCSCGRLIELYKLPENENYLPREPCGAPEYLSPEMLDGLGVDEMNDWWNLGIMIYELIIGHSPFFRRNRHHMFVCIKTSVVHFPEYDFHKEAPYSISINAETRDIINRLLDKDANRRLGKNGVDEILSHPFFAEQHKNRAEIENRTLQMSYAENFSERP
jgi:serine/threonine protein kinase